MKSSPEFLQESMTINGDFNGTLTYGGVPGQQQQEESFSADIVWEGKIYRLEVEGSMMSRNELAEHIQGEYPGAVVQTVYPGSSQSRIKSAQRYRPEKLNWSD